MAKQTSFAAAEYGQKKKTTRREKFLFEMEKVVPWARLIALIEPHYPKGKRGRPPIGVERMLRLYFLQNWYSLADEAMEDAIYDSQALRNFTGIDLGADAVPDATTLLHFRHLLETHNLSEAIFEAINAMLRERNIQMREGTMVDATIIAAPPSTKNQSGKSAPDMHQTRKGNQWLDRHRVALPGHRHRPLLAQNWFTSFGYRLGAGRPHALAVRHRRPQAGARLAFENTQRHLP